MPDSENHQFPSSKTMSDASSPQTVSRPRIPPRYPSYSKRHASFNSPREVPLPSPTIYQSEAPNPFAATAPFNQQTASSSKAQDVFESHSKPSSPTRSPNALWTAFLENNDRQAARPRSPVLPSHRSHVAHDDLITPRKHNKANHASHLSLGSSSAASAALLSQPARESKPSRSAVPPPADPVPSHKDPAPPKQAAPSPIYTTNRPFSLPDAQSTSYSSTLSSYLRPSSPSSPSSPMRSTTWIDRCSSASLPLPSQVAFYSLPRVNTNNQAATTNKNNLDSDRGDTRSSSSSSSSFAGSSKSSGSSDCPSLRSSSLDGSNSSSSSLSGSSGTYPSTGSSPNTEHSFPESSMKGSPPPPPSKFADVTTPRADNTQPAPRPIPRPVSPFRAPMPPQTSSRPQAAYFPEAAATAMRRFMAPSPASSIASASSYPPPEPPVILPAEPTDDMTQPATRSQAPYVPFLSHAPPPPDSWIEVETTNNEYKLNVRLPGFSRESITLATKRRRILHVVADSWENGGGHFERRISFGYDADLVQVRAEFDGVMLRVTIPRRTSPVQMWAARGPVGRA